MSLFPLCVFTPTAFWNSSPPRDSHQQHLLTRLPLILSAYAARRVRASSPSLQDLMGSLSKYAKSLFHLMHDMKWLHYFFTGDSERAEMYSAWCQAQTEPSATWASRVQLQFSVLHFSLYIQRSYPEQKLRWKENTELSATDTTSSWKRVSTTTTEYFFPRGDVKRIQIRKKLFISSNLKHDGWQMVIFYFNQDIVIVFSFWACESSRQNVAQEDPTPDDWVLVQRCRNDSRACRNVNMLTGDTAGVIPPQGSKQPVNYFRFSLLSKSPWMRSWI